ncbi:MAG: LacI family DNA-binding transcriptional regulator [Vagococcus sp.]
MSVKLTDVAKKAGVSPTTVSRVINNYGYLSQKTIDNVRQAMDELNYVPNSAARSLQGKKNNLIGLIFPSVSNPFYGELIERIETKLFNKGYKAILCDSAHDEGKEKEYLKMLAANKVDGIITGSHNLGIKEYETIPLPIVSFDRYLADNIPIVGSDNDLGARLATTALIEKGCQRIAILSGSNDSMSPTNQRVDGYVKTMTLHNLAPIVCHLPSHSSPTIKRMEIKRLFESNPDLDGVFCTDDLTALLVLDFTKENDINVPDRLKVIGYDGTELIQTYFSDLTTIVQPIDDYASLLIDMLLKKIDTPSIAIDNLQLPVTLHVSHTI